MQSLPPPFSSSDFSEPLIRSNTFTSLSPGSGSFTQTRRDNAVIQMTPPASYSRRRSELPALPRQKGSAEPSEESVPSRAPSPTPPGRAGPNGMLLALPSLGVREQGASPGPVFLKQMGWG